MSLRFDPTRFARQTDVFVETGTLLGDRRDTFWLDAKHQTTLYGSLDAIARSPLEADQHPLSPGQGDGALPR